MWKREEYLNDLRERLKAKGKPVLSEKKEQVAWMIIDSLQRHGGELTVEEIYQEFEDYYHVPVIRGDLD